MRRSACRCLRTPFSHVDHVHRARRCWHRAPLLASRGAERQWAWYRYQGGGLYELKIVGRARSQIAFEPPTSSDTNEQITPRVDRRTALRQLSVGAFAANGTRDGGPKVDAAAATPAAVATRAPAGACILPALRGGGDGLDAAVTAVSQPAAAEAAALAAITGAGKATLQPPLVLAPRGQAKRQWAWYEGSARRSSRALRKKRKARALRAKKVAEAIADGRGEDDLPGQQVPCGAHRWIGGRRAGALP